MAVLETPTGVETVSSPDPAPVLEPSTPPDRSAPSPRHQRRPRHQVTTPTHSSLRFAPPIAVLAVVGTVHAIGMGVWPSFGNDDEGTYMARAWAVQTGLGAHGGPAPYTYWYDHPPFGWIQLTLWTSLTHTFRAGTIAVASGRGDMLIYTLVSTALLYVLLRRLGCSTAAGIGAMLLFGLSPLSVQNLRLVMLDTIGLPWIIAAFVLALSPRRRLWAFAASGLAFAGAVLTKETFLLLLPALVWQVWQRSRGPTRRMCVVVFSACAAATILYYPLYAFLKGELFPGKGHVSLIGGIEWQLSSRLGSGSVLDAGSAANLKLVGWLHVDPWLLGLGLCGLPVAILVRRTRPVALAYLIFLLSLLRHGYLPDTFITGALPFAAVVAASAADIIWRRGPAFNIHPRRLLARSPARHGATRSIPISKMLLVTALVAIGVMIAPRWASADRQAMSTNDIVAYSAAEQWITKHVPRSDPVLVDDDLWIDLVDDGYQPNRVVWYEELDQDPEVTARFPEGWKDFNYVVVSHHLRVTITARFTQLTDALRHSIEITRFGSATTWESIYKIEPNYSGPAPWWLPGYGTGVPPISGPDKGERY